MSKGKLTIYIGPNGSGKTYELNKMKGKENSFMVPSEIIFLEETKDTKDSTIVMEQLIGELIMPNIIDEKKRFEEKVDDVIKENKKVYNDKLSEILNINGTKLKKDFINCTAKKEYKKIVSIDNAFLKESMGSGQASLFILSLLTMSKKENILIDEPEKFCHQSLLNKVAGVIRELLEMGKNVYIATHSPELVKLLDWDFENLFVFNELEIEDEKIKNSTIKQINVSDISKVLIESGLDQLLINNGKKELKIIGSYFQESQELEKYLKIRRNDFIDLLFANNIYLVEGINDMLFVNFKEKNNYEERKVFPTFSKFLIPMYLVLLNQVRNEKLSKISVVFDCDNNKDELHSRINKFIIDYSDYYIKFADNIEVEFDIQKEDKNNPVLVFEEFEKNAEKFNSINWEKGKAEN
jgi:Fe-S cluster assembly ATPase SufC